MPKCCCFIQRIVLLECCCQLKVKMLKMPSTCKLITSLYDEAHTNTSTRLSFMCQTVCLNAVGVAIMLYSTRCVFIINVGAIFNEFQEKSRASFIKCLRKMLL